MSLFQTSRVMQLSFCVSSKKLARIMRDISDFNVANGTTGSKAVNLSAIMQEGRLTRLVPGVADQPQTAVELQRVKCILKRYCVKFCEDIVLRVSSTAVPGVFFQRQMLLNSIDEQVIASYLDESGSRIIFVDDFCRAERVLSKTAEQALAIIQCMMGC